MKRQRVEIACDKCRGLKAKCDGRQPICGRCEGYGFQCNWSMRRRTAAQEKRDDGAERHLENSPPAAVEQLANLTSYHQMMESYEMLIDDIRAKLDASDRLALDLNLSNIRRQKPEDLAHGVLSKHGSEGHQQSKPSSVTPPSYVGKVSEIHFIRAVHRCIQDPELSELTGEPGYGSPGLSDHLVSLNRPLLLPPKEKAYQFLNVYLSTIHIAYPFLSRRQLLEELESLWDKDCDNVEYQPWRALFSFIFAIGSYYTSFPHRKETPSSQHFRYFQQGLYFSYGIDSNCSLISIWVLLVQCFFLLAICQTDRCWNTLGLAIRMGQSIGLHVEASSTGSTQETSTECRSQQRRTWYSMYVLDRLLALQLGRPMAIHEGDSHVELPSLQDQSAFAMDTNEHTLDDTHVSSMMAYFRAVICFSSIVSQVICELYRPSQIDLRPDQMLHSASSLDQQLAQWKESLARHLRFDRGHTFEKSISFKRQRNMLAVKFHHLRALIYRPFLCLPLLQAHNESYMDLLMQHKSEISHAEWACISAAQETAKLLHNVVDERSLVHDFPWWQMISCLICASSILFVAEAFYRDHDLLEGRTSASCVRDDAEICLQVFKALSANSDAAKKAADMLERLSHLRFSVVVGREYHSDVGPCPLQAAIPATQFLGGSVAPTDVPSISVSDIPAPLFPSCWPSEISNSMEWSIQFLDHTSFSRGDSEL
ncbi:fungal-specific transcription factor domain-containing protein [Aspergillus tamarii]|uniref:Fungal-specific transcription factor domain-containing protein n=1 Tax=Aspergillus tamarii TaxID=41984 RepID=A0A5N6VBP3_ASPTM|nr:fungal-specific transcription factor domain-containing protein [Aspergillus tamarii]